MAIVLVQLKLAIQRRAWGRKGLGQRIAFVLVWLLALVLGLALGALVAAADSQRMGAGDFGILLIFTGIFLGWVIFPILMPGIADESVDPRRLELFPIRVRDQVVGLLLGGLLGPAALFTLLVAAGGTAASGESLAARGFVLLGAVVFTVLCVAASRSVQALLSGALRSRRGRDVVVAASGVIAIGVYLMAQQAQDFSASLLGLESSPAEGVLAWLPPGSVGQSTLDARDGAWGDAVVHLLVGAVAIPVFLALWAWAIRRRVRGASGGGSQQKETPSGGEAGLDLIPAPLSALRATPAVAAGGQQLRYFFFRSPTALQTMLIPVVMGAVLGHSIIGDGNLLIGAGFFAIMVVSVGSVAFNVFGFDGPGFAYLLMSGARLGPVLKGKIFAPLVVLVPLVGVFVVVEATLNGLWADALAAFLVGTAVLLGGIGVGAQLSVRAPQNRTGGRSINKGKAILGALAGMLGVFVLAGLVLFASLLLSDLLNETVLSALTLAAMALLALLLVRQAGHWLEHNSLKVAHALGV